MCNNYKKTNSMQKKSIPVSLKQIELIAEKRQMVLNSIEKFLPNQQKEFLLFMAKSVDNISNYENLSLTDLTDLFIEFEEENNGLPLTQEIMNELMEIYIPGFKKGVF